MLYRAIRRQLASFQSTIFALHARNIDHVVSSALQNYFANTRAVFGTKTYMDHYPLTVFDPPDFWCWFQNIRCSQDSRFIRTGFNIVPSNYRSNQYVKANFPSQSEYPNNLFGVEGVTSSTSPNRQYLDATSGGSFLYIYFSYAIVNVQRPWFNPSLFNLYPLGVKNVRTGNWSDANYNGEFPWYITKLVIVKDIYINSLNRNFGSTIVQMIERIRTNPKLKGNFGPFVFSNSPNKYGTTSFTYSSFSRMLFIRGPQVVGYVVSKLPRFPNYEEQEQFYKG